MPRNGTGTYSLPEAPFTAGTVISSAAVNDDLSDIATALTGSLPRDGQAGMIGQFKAVDGSTVIPAISFNNDPNTGFYRPGADQLGVVVNGAQVALFTTNGLPGLLPIGAVIDFGGSAVPSLWLLCYGQAVSRVTYAALFTAIGTAFGSGDGSTTFNLPDLRGRVCYGKDDMGGVASGRITTTYYVGTPTLLGSGGGLQSKALGLTNLPPYTPSGTIGIGDPTHSHGVGGNGNGSFVVAGAGGSQSGGGAFGIPNGSISINAAATGISGSFNGIAQGGASTAFANLSPGLIFNKLIYAGV